MFKKYRDAKQHRVDAKKWEDRAYAVEQEQAKSGNYGPEPVSFYERAGKEWQAVGDETEAGSAYRSALRDAKKANEKKSGTISREKIRELEKWVPKSLGPAWVVLVIAGVLAGLFFLSPNITGNAIGNLTSSNSSIIGATLLIVGILVGYFYLKR